MLGNQQETKDICRVGSSATIRSLSSNTQSELHWNQWLAGLIDASPCQKKRPWFYRIYTLNHKARLTKSLRLH